MTLNFGILGLGFIKLFRPITGSSFDTRLRSEVPSKIYFLKHDYCHAAIEGKGSKMLKIAWMKESIS